MSDGHAATLRPPRDADVAGVARLCDAMWPSAITEAEIRRIWSSPTITAETDVRIAVEEDGTPAGYADVYDPGGGGSTYWAWIHGRPGPALVEWALSRATELSSGPGARLLCATWSEDANVKAALAGAGFRLARHSYRMEIELAGDEPEARVPAGLTVRSFRAGDERAVYEAHQETFADARDHTRQPYDEWAHWSLESADFDPSLWFLAFDEAELAGIALCMREEDEEGVGWVSTLGVRRPWRRRGLGGALLRHAFAAFARRGFRAVGLGVDAESLTGAHRLYESAGMRVAAVWDVYEHAVS